MFYALKGNLRSRGGNGFMRRARRALCAVLLSMLVSVAASAYTLVLKSGRRIEIPASFIVTSLTLTYETAPGLNVTLLISTINIPATERANNEAAGALLARAERKALSSGTSVQSRNQRRELTQADIERGRIERRKSEQAYERRRVELGLPSLEEARRRTEEETKRLREESLKYQADLAESESYWRERATQLRTEMAALDGQINYVRARLGESPDYSSIGSYTFINSGAPFLYPRRATTRFPVVVGNPGFMRGANVSPVPGAGFAAFGGTGAQLNSQVNVGVGRGNFVGRGRFAGITGAPLALYGSPNSNYYYDQANLINHLHDLETARAGLQARWRVLEEDARRAGAQPGWLRP